MREKKNQKKDALDIQFDFFFFLRNKNSLVAHVFFSLIQRK